MHSIEANGAAIPALGLGTWTLRGDECRDLVEAAIAAGYRHIDTARMYRNERDVGEGIAASGIGRDELFVTTKVWPDDLAPKDFRRSAEASLKDLGLDHVDLLLIHWPSSSVPLADTIGALNQAREAGLTRHIGVANFPTALLAKALDLSAAPLACNQVEYHPYLDQAKVRAACRKAGMAMVSYCPLYRGGSLFDERAIEDACARHGRTPGQVVLRWHVQQEGVVAIPRTSRRERLAENIAVFDFELSDGEMATISGLAGQGKRLCDFGFSPPWDR